MASNPTARNALNGFRVLDLTTTIAGPYCARLLADVGADVIKIESREGEVMRTAPPVRDGASAYFGQLNAGKRSIAIDLKSRAGADILRRLVQGADVLVENYRPGVMRRLGLDYPGLAALKPDLIYCAISGYGQTGPAAELPAYAPAIHAASGFDLAHLSYQDDRTLPDACGIYIADVLAGTHAFGAVQTALLVRERTGLGQMIDLSMLEAMLGLLLPEVQRAQFEVQHGRPLYQPLPTADGYIMPAVGSDRTFQGLVRATGRTDWLTDPRFADVSIRRLHWGDLLDELAVWSASRTVAECKAAFDANGVPCSPYFTVAEAMASDQVAHRGALAEVEDAGGTFRAINPPFRFSEGRAELGARAAALGEHTRQVLRDAGYTDAQVDAFYAEKAVV